VSFKYVNVGFVSFLFSVIKWCRHQKHHSPRAFHSSTFHRKHEPDVR